MRKEELRKLRALPATREMMQKGKRFSEKIETDWNGRKRKKVVPNYDILLRVQNLSGYIKIAVFLPEKMRKGIKTPRYEIFLNVEGEEYITRELDDKGEELRWLTAMIPNLDDLGYYNWYYLKNVNVHVSRDGMYTLNSLELKNDRSEYKGLLRLAKWQQEQKDKHTKRREQREQAPWDADMQLIPKLPKGFEEWMRKEAAGEYYMIYEYEPKGQKTGYCSKCKKQVQIAGPKHGKKTKCPSCKVETVFKAHTRLQTLSTGGYNAQIIQKFSEGIVIRLFEQRQWYRDAQYTEPHIHTSEAERIMFFDDGTVKRYVWDSYKQKYHRWILDKSYFAGKRIRYYSKVKLYRKNLAKLKEHTMLKQSAIELWPTLPASVPDYIQMEKANPAIEKLARLGMFRLAGELIEERYDHKLLNESATELAKMLQIDKNRLKRLKEMDGNIFSLRWMQHEKSANTIWPDELIKDFGDAKFKTSVFSFLDISLSVVKCHNYLKKQASIMGESIAQVLITWRDYLNMAERLKMNKKCEQIVKPKDLKYAHDELVLLEEKKGLEKQAREIEKKWPKVNEQLSKLQKFEYTRGEYTIVAPKSVLDIVTEGTILKHCVHTCDYYFDRIQNDESYLFFLRKSKQSDVPWYTLEVEPSGNIRQKRTTGDNQNPDFQKAVPFLKKWQQYFNKMLTEEEKQLGEKSDRLRKENYRNLRENGNRVWHGKLAGKLLADVLEQDFMEVAGG